MTRRVVDLEALVTGHPEAAWIPRSAVEEDTFMAWMDANPADMRAGDRLVCVAHADSVEGVALVFQGLVGDLFGEQVVHMTTEPHGYRVLASPAVFTECARHMHLLFPWRARGFGVRTPVEDPWTQAKRHVQDAYAEDTERRRAEKRETEKRRNARERLRQELAADAARARMERQAKLAEERARLEREVRERQDRMRQYTQAAARERQRRETEAKVRAEAEAESRAKAEAEAEARARAKARAEAEAEARAKARARAEAEAKAKTTADRAPAADAPETKQAVDDVILGPSGSQTPPSFFEILGVPRGASSREISKAYHVLAKRFHPDKLPKNLQEDPTYIQAFRRIGAAVETLKDDTARAAYVRNLDLRGALAANREANFVYGGRRRASYGSPRM
jgi:hypothetical protein